MSTSSYRHAKTTRGRTMGRSRHRSSHELDRTRRRRRIAVMAGLTACSAVVWQSSHATFTGTTTNSANTLGAGTVVITDNDAGVAMFNASNLTPGASAAVCMGVSYTGSLTPSAIKLYFTGATESNNGGAYVAWANDTTSEMDDNTTLQIQVNSADLASDPGSSCAPAGYVGFTDVAAAAPGTSLKTLINTDVSFAAGLPSQWGTIVATKWRVFKFTYTFSASAPNSSQGDGTKFNVVWEAQS
jgi:hypothetical protein